MERWWRWGALLVGLALCLGAADRASALGEVEGLGAAGEKVAVHEVYGWGLNNVGQLGLVDFQERWKPALLSVLKDKNVTALAVGGNEQVDSHTLAIVSPGKLYTTGDNTYGQLGVGDHLDREAFEPLQAVFHSTFVAVACGEAHSVALTSKGEVYAWGSNTRGQLCLGAGDGAAQADLPTVVPLPFADRVAGIAAGAWHTVVWTAGGKVWTCGDNSFGQLGVGERSQELGQGGLVQAILPKALQIAEVAAGGHHNLVLTRSGEIYAWGKNGEGQLGVQQEDVRKAVYALPEMLPSFTEAAVMHVFAGHLHSLAIDSRGTLHAWGENNHGQLGVAQLGSGGVGAVRRTLADTPSRPVHAPRMVMPTTKWYTVACGRTYTVGVTMQGKVYAWGANNAGQLGLGDLGVHGTPQVVGVLNLKKVAAVAAGSATAFAVTNTGELYGWGKNNAGQLGLPRSATPRSTPELVLSAHSKLHVAQVAAGGYGYQYEGHSMLLTSKAEVYSWGWNAFGQLGIGEVDDAHAIPQRNSWLHALSVQSVAVGQFASAAVTATGELYTWGQNDCGQLGKGDTTTGPFDLPQKIHFDVAITKVTIGYSHMLALSVDGRVYSWGHNFYGQLGIGDHKDRNSPQLLSYLQEEKILKVVAGQYHSLAVAVNGEVYGWGYNRDYELGVGDNMDRVLPQAVPLLSGRKVTALTAGGYHTLAVTEDGTLYSWGLNNYGQLGHKEHSTSKVPTVVAVTVNLVDGKQAGRRLRVKMVAAGTWHSLVLAENDAVYSFGRCQHGQLGVRCHVSSDTTQDVFAPTPVTDALEGKKVVAIAAGAAHSIAVVGL